MPDRIEINILADGTIKMDSGVISAPNHASAEQFIRETSRLAGGKSERKRKSNAQGHTHTHKHERHSH